MRFNNNFFVISFIRSWKFQHGPFWISSLVLWTFSLTVCILLAARVGVFFYSLLLFFIGIEWALKVWCFNIHTGRERVLLYKYKNKYRKSDCRAKKKKNLFTFFLWVKKKPWNLFVFLYFSSCFFFLYVCVWARVSLESWCAALAEVTKTNTLTPTIMKWYWWQQKPIRRIKRKIQKKKMCQKLLPRGKPVIMCLCLYLCMSSWRRREMARRCVCARVCLCLDRVHYK